MINTDPRFFEEVEARRNLALNKTLFQEKNTLGLSQIAYAFLKDPLLKRIRTKNHPHIRHIAETMSIKDRKSCVLCCGSCIPDFPNQQNHKYREGYQTVNRCRFCKVYLCNESRRFLGDLSCFDYWHATEHILFSLYKHPFRQLVSPPLAIETPTSATPAKYSSNPERPKRQKIEAEVDSEEN